MNELILSLFMLTGLEEIKESLRPQPTQEQIYLVEKLGDRNWRIREDADKKLRKMGYEALVAIEKMGLRSKCPETSSRAEKIHDFYFQTTDSNQDIPNCTGLFKLNEVQLKNGKTIQIPHGTAKEYLKQIAENNENHQIFNCCYVEPDSDDEWMLKKATILFIKSLYRAGYRQEEVIEVIDAITENQKKWRPYDLRQDEGKIEYSGQFDS